MSKVLVYIEHAHGKLPKASAVAVTAAQKAGDEVVALVLGKGIGEVATAAAGLTGVAKVVAIDDDRLEHYLADIYAAATVQVADAEGADIVVAAATAIGKDFCPRVAQKRGAGMASEISGINDDGTIVRPIYAGNVLATTKINTEKKVITVRGTAFEPAAAGGSASVEAAELAADVQSKMKFVSFEETISDRPQLADADIVVSGGRGLKSGENFKEVLEPLVDALGAAMGASRAAVDAGFVPNDLQVGQTGKVVAPQLYIAVGISGAIQH
ncbi:MAG: electron transfer flavoprotein subunit alpha/FixB family protein, partial [bacterium]